MSQVCVEIKSMWVWFSESDLNLQYSCTLLEVLLLNTKVLTASFASMKLLGNLSFTVCKCRIFNAYLLFFPFIYAKVRPGTIFPVSWCPVLLSLC